MTRRNLVLGLGLCASVVACRAPWRSPEGNSDTEAPAAAWVSVPASDARLQYTGRRYSSDEGVVFSHPGVTIRARFQGDAVRMRLNDFASGELGPNYFDVSLDGAPPVQLAVHAGQSTWPLATGLPVGLHTVEIVKRTESSVGHTELVALEVRGELREPPPRPTLRMEFVGDSITCGYGTDVSLIPESPSWRAPGFTSKNENPARSYGWLTARHLGAELVTICYSGHGLYRNLDMTTSELLPALYELAVPGQPVAWDFSRYSPDVIVINVGTNDVLAGSGTVEFLPDETAFKTAYRKFLARLRALHPRAHIVCTLGSMTDGFKQHEQGGTVYAAHAGEWVTQLVEERNREGDARVYRHMMAVQNPGADGVGEDWHPSSATHQKMAEALSRFLQDTVLR